MSIRVEVKEDKIYTYTPWSPGYKDKAKQIGGKWDSFERAWVFDSQHEELVDKALIEFYGVGVDGEGEKIIVEYDASSFEKDSSVMIGNLITVSRFARDMPVDVKNGTVVIEGEFEGKGGSWKHPQVDADGVVLRSEIPLAIYNSLPEDQKEKLRVSNSSKLEALRLEKERLLKQIEELDKMIDSMK